MPPPLTNLRFPMTPKQVLSHIAEIAPMIGITVNRTEDPYFEWDGEGPDPRDEGYHCYTVDVMATTIIGGKAIHGANSIAGVYEMPNKHDPDINGYFLDMLIAALMNLKNNIEGGFDFRSKGFRDITSSVLASVRFHK